MKTYLWNEFSLNFVDYGTACKYDTVKFSLIAILSGYILHADGCLSMLIYCNLTLESLTVIICL